MPEAVPWHMITFAPMVGSEIARLLLRRYDVDYVEEDHLFGWASVVSLVHGGRGAIPILVGPRATLRGVRTLVDTFEPIAPPERRLRPAELAVQAEADWQVFYTGFKADVAIFAYYHLLPRRDLLVPVFAEPVRGIEGRLTGAVYGALRWLFTVLLKLDAANATAAGERILSTLRAYDQRLADGRPFLLGDRLTLGDVALAGGCAPLLQPQGFGTVMPPINAMPAPMRALIAAVRESPAACFVDNVYASLGKIGAEA